MSQNLGMQWESLLFNIRMANNQVVVPKGMVKSARIQIDGIEYVVNLVVNEKNDNKNISNVAREALAERGQGKA